MELVLALLAVFIAAAVPTVEILFVIPAGILVGLPAVPTALVATVGNLATLVPVIAGGERLRRRWARRRGRDPAMVDRSPRRQRARRMVARFGVPGLALLAPIVTGVHVAALGAIATGARRGLVLAWFAASLALWAIVISLLVVLGVGTFVEPDQLPGFLDAAGPG
ncbi:MAG: small multi-drug export protein [Nitriliruptoraceae bacterium]